MRRLFLLITVLAVPPALASDVPSYDCAEASSDTERLICASPELAILDKRLSERFAAALVAARSLASGAREQEASLRASQRGWIKGRDDCWKANDVEDCVRFSYLARENELVALWMLEEPASVTVWTCDRNPANEVVTMFFQTELPSVRFERADSIDAGSLSPTASGSRYDGTFGRFIWMKGNAATYRDPDPSGKEFSCLAAN